MKKFTIDDAYEIDVELKKKEKERKRTEEKHLEEAGHAAAQRVVRETRMVKKSLRRAR